MSNQHDEQIDRLLTALHRRDDGGASAECLDGETLAAWMDDRLGGPALARVEAHAAMCARCQSVAAAMARMADAGLEDRGGGAPARSGFWRMLPWAAPLMAAATAAALYIAVRPAPPPAPNELRTSASRQVSPESEAASSPRTEADATASPAPGAAKSNDSRAPQGQASASAGQPGAAAATLAPPTVEQKQRLAAQDAAETRRVGQVAASPPPPPAPLPERRELKDVMKSSEPAALPRVPEGTATVRSAPPPSPAVPVTSGYVRSRAEASAATPEALEESVRVSLVIRTPDPAVLWRITAATVLQVSRDGGTTWTTQDMGVPATLTAGAAPSASVCWLAGRSGLILRTIDGRTWQRIAFPERADLVGILATSADAATVTTSDGRMLVTADGGKTWRPRR